MKNLFMVLAAVGTAGLSYANLVHTVINCNSNERDPQLTIRGEYYNNTDINSFLNENVEQTVSITDKISRPDMHDTPLTAKDTGGDLFLTEFGVGMENRFNFSAFHHNTVISFVSDQMTLGPNDDQGNPIGALWKGKYVYSYSDPGLQSIYTPKDVLCSLVQNGDANGISHKSFLKRLLENLLPSNPKAKAFEDSQRAYVIKIMRAKGLAIPPQYKDL